MRSEDIPVVPDVPDQLRQIAQNPDLSGLFEN
jgi:hypothetical protein